MYTLYILEVWNLKMWCMVRMELSTPHVIQCGWSHHHITSSGDTRCAHPTLSLT